MRGRVRSVREKRTCVQCTVGVHEVLDVASKQRVDYFDNPVSKHLWRACSPLEVRVPQPGEEEHNEVVCFVPLRWYTGCFEPAWVSARFLPGFCLVYAWACVRVLSCVCCPVCYSTPFHCDCDCCRCCGTFSVTRKPASVPSLYKQLSIIQWCT